jgi:hypothetical protein
MIVHLKLLMVNSPFIALLYARVVIGENSTFLGGESILKAHGVEVVNLNLES